MDDQERPQTFFHVPGVGSDGSYQAGEFGGHGAHAEGYLPLRKGDIAAIDLKGAKVARYRVREVEFYADARGRAPTGLHVFLEKIDGEEYDY